MTQLPPGIRNIIFDLGGVILNLSVDTTLREMARLSGKSHQQVMEIFRAREEFLSFEKGIITEEEFRSALRDMYQLQCADAELDRCWNAMLLDIPVQKIGLLRQLQANYKTFLLSNTNAIHLRAFTRRLNEDHGLASLDELFHRVYYSQMLGMRKPDVEIYQHVLQESGLQPEETIFLDDNPDNIHGATKAGIHTFFVGHPDDVYKLFK